MATQRCPACGTLHDVGVYVTGKRVRCRACGLHFTVERPESIIAARAGRRVAAAAAGRAGNAAPVQQSAVAVADTSPVGSGLTIPGFEIHEMLGKGGMGRVYRARQVSLDRWVAIKILNEDLAKHHSFIRRFEKESGALASLSHPNITAIFDRGSANGRYYFVMEYVGGPSLRHKMQAGLEIRESLQLFAVLCQAVAHAHKRSVVHRDLKPENVLFSEEGILKVADFGLANIIAPDRRWELTRTKVSMGTVNYMAPEQRQDAKHVDHRADIYSLGVMLYEMLTGELPVGRFRPPSQTRPGIDERLDRVVMRMLDIEPQQRPQNAGLIAATLESWLREKNSHPARAVGSARAAASAETTRPRSSPRPLSRAPRTLRVRRMLSRTLTNRLAWWIAALALVLAAGLSGLWWLMQQGLSDRPGDLRLTGNGSNQTVAVVHPRQLTYISPSHIERDGQSVTAVFDFLPSSQESQPLQLLGGVWLKKRGFLVQDTLARGFAVNQIPARALFGNTPYLPDATHLETTMEVRPAQVNAGGKTLSMQDYLDQSLGGTRLLIPLTISHRAGLGFLDAAGRGLELLLPLQGSRTGIIMRRGEGMEGGNHDFPLPEAAQSTSASWQLRMDISDGRVKVSLNGIEVVNELAGFPLGFRGLATISCQNARCRIKRVALRHQR